MSAPMDQAPDNAFEQKLAEYYEYVGEPPVESAGLFKRLDDLEKTGLGLVSTEEVDMSRLAATLHQVFGGIADLEIVPPMRAPKKNLVAGKYAAYAALSEALSGPQAATPKPTDNSGIKTDEAKS